MPGWWHRADAHFNRRIIARNSGRYCGRDRPALTVSDGVVIGRTPAFAATNSMGSRAPFAPPAERYSLTIVLSIINRSASSSRQRARRTYLPRCPARPLGQSDSKWFFFGPYSAGQSAHRPPHLSTVTMPLSTRRSSMVATSNYSV